MTTPPRLPAECLLRDSPERNVGLALPLAISDRVDALVTVVEQAGERTSRKELIASLILAAGADGEELATVLRRYRQTSVRDALVEPVSGPNAVRVRRPGPRPRRGG